MEIRNLKTFLRVAALRNFTHAAKDLGYSQANVSAQIQQLEQEVGATLFNRIGRQVALTQHGESLLPYAQELCSIAVKMENLLRTKEFICGTVRIGITDSLSELRLEDALLSYHRRFPQVQVELFIDTTAKLLDRLRKGQLDAAFVITDPLLPTEWLIRSSWHTSIVIVGNPSLPITARPSIGLADLMAESLILMEEDAPYSLSFEHALAERQLSCRPVFRLQSALAACHMVQRGAFLSVLPFYTVQSAVKTGQVIILNVPEWRHQQVIQAVLHRSRVLTPQLEGFFEEFEQFFDHCLAE